MNAATPGQAACAAFWEAVRGDLARTGDAWDWALGQGVTEGWELAAQAGHAAIAARQPQPSGKRDPPSCPCCVFGSDDCWCRTDCGAERCQARDPDAAQQPQPAPGGLREALAEQVATWRDHAADMATGTRDEMTEGYAAGECAKELAAILDEHPAAEPQPAPKVTSETAARAAYHVMWTASGVDVRWEDLDPQDRHVWARIALAAIDAWGARPQPAPELAATQAALARVLAWFPTSGTRNAAAATRAQLARAYADGGLDVPEELQRFL